MAIEQIHLHNSGEGESTHVKRGGKGRGEGTAEYSPVFHSHHDPMDDASLLCNNKIHGTEVKILKSNIRIFI